MIVLQQLKKATSLNDLAELLKCKPSYLSFVLYKIPDDQKYSEFSIPKKNGEFRKINKPIKSLKRIQTSLAVLLSKCYEEVSVVSSGKQKRQLSHGFRKDCSIITNALNHTNKRHVFNIDLEDFFPSINFGRVRGFFIKNNHFKLDPIVATIIAQIACHKNELPQGSPCSPVISNFIGHVLDVRMASLAKKAKCTYSRYADDITFSTNKKEFPELISVVKPIADGEEWVPAKILRAEVKRAGFTINKKKTSLQHKSRRQIATGLVINNKVNVKMEYYKRARTMCYSLFETGKFFIHGKYDHSDTESPANSASDIGSKIYSGKYNTNIHGEYIKGDNSDAITVDSVVQREKIGATPKPYIQGKLRQLEGILNYIYNVKKAHFNNKKYDKFKIETEEDLEIKKSNNLSVEKDTDPDTKSQIAPKKKKKQDKPIEEPKGVSKLYRELLFFKYFFSLEHPLILCEGKTDITYLKCALRQLEGEYPNLIQKKEMNLEFQIRFLSLNKYLRSVFCMAGGCTGLVSLIHMYEKQIARFKGKGKKHPVIILFDNDKGSSIIKSYLRDNFNEYKTEDWTKPFYYLCHNLFVVFTPFNSDGKETAMEDFFGKEVFDYKIKDKKFNSDPSIDTEFGKAVFAAEIVKANQKSIDFGGFKEILNRLVAVIDNYNKGTV